MVVCEEDSEHEYYKSAPILIIEVLSESTRKFDKTHKRLTYQNIPSLEEYAIIEQERCEIEVFRRKDHWQSTYTFRTSNFGSVRGGAWVSVKGFASMELA